MGRIGGEVGTVGTTWPEPENAVVAVGVGVAVPEPVARAPELEAVVAAVETMLEATVVQATSLRRAWGWWKAAGLDHEEGPWTKKSRAAGWSR